MTGGHNKEKHLMPNATRKHYLMQHRMDSLRRNNKDALECIELNMPYQMYVDWHAQWYQTTDVQPVDETLYTYLETIGA